jgi:hypothetical protein
VSAIDPFLEEVKGTRFEDHEFVRCVKSAAYEKNVVLC